MKPRKAKISSLMRIAMTTHVESVKDLLSLLRKADWLDSIHKELEERWELQRITRFWRNCDRWYKKDRKERAMKEAKKADRWPRWFWKYWGFVSKEAWDSYIASKENDEE